jgi:hypothetical protein
MSSLAAAKNWCKNATRLTKTEWRYIKVPQRAFEALQPSRLEHLRALDPAVAASLEGGGTNFVNFRLRSGVVSGIKDKPSRTSVAGWADGVLDGGD